VSLVRARGERPTDWPGRVLAVLHHLVKAPAGLVEMALNQCLAAVIDLGVDVVVVAAWCAEM